MSGMTRKRNPYMIKKKKGDNGNCGIRK